jgi:hypothetical protein
MDDEQLRQGIRTLVATATGDPLGVEVLGGSPDGVVKLIVNFTRRPERFDFLPFMAQLAPISESRYSSPFGERCWTIAGQFGGRRVKLSLRIEFLLGVEEDDPERTTDYKQS